MIRYATSADAITPDRLAGFFVGWPNPPSPETHLRILRASAFVALAVDEDSDRVVGFANAISDGVLSAYVPLLEVLPEYRGQGVGSALVRLLLEQLDGLYMVDLTCDAELEPFYRALGLIPSHGMSLRRYTFQSGAPR